MPDPKKYDMDFRPAAYFDSSEKTRQNGDFIESTNRSSSGDEDRAASGAIPRTLYGDLFLPNREEEDVEIARVELESATFDVISVRARLQDGKIHYSVVDEYEDLYGWECEPETSDQPLTMAELIELMKNTRSKLDHPGIVFGFLDFKCEYGEDAEDLRNFASVSSWLYPDLHDWYEEAMEEWCEAKQRDDEASDEGPIEIFIAFADQHGPDPSLKEGDYLDEPVKVFQVGPRQWRLEQNPSFTEMAAYKDTVEGDFDENDVLIVKRVVEKSGLRTIRAEVPRMFYRFDFGKAVLDRVMEAGGRWEFTLSGILVVNLPANDAEELEEMLEAAGLEAKLFNQTENSAPSQPDMENPQAGTTDTEERD